MRIESFVPLFVIFGVLTVMLGSVFLTRRLIARRDRRSPIKQEMLRGPGHALRERIDDLAWDFASLLAFGPLVPLALYAMYLQHRLNGGSASLPLVGIYAVTAAAVVIFSTRKMVRILVEIRRLRLGLEAEIVAAEELNLLMRSGYSVFHDVPGDGPFNIDHVVAGPAGVFAIETKGRMQRKEPAKSDGHVVRTNGSQLDFPGWSETKPIEQASRNARWLAQWLSRATGEGVRVEPVVLLPGWYVKRSDWGGVSVLNPKEMTGFLASRRGAAHDPAQQQRIAHQLDGRCRTVESKVAGQRRKAS
ncbi:MAG: NERD domain-containing protein [Steroidobacteraceae bacterium]|nr:NERD domain-containing protein [Steroidobacteraceae bacterium]